MANSHSPGPEGPDTLDPSSIPSSDPPTGHPDPGSPPGSPPGDPSSLASPADLDDLFAAPPAVVARPEATDPGAPPISRADAITRPDLPRTIASDEPQDEPQGEGPPMPSSFAELGELPDWLTAALVRLSWDVPTPVQALTFQAVSAGTDVLVQSQTGSGKTGAFCVPWLANRFEAGAARDTGVQMLVLVPTRELAKQVASVLVDLSRDSDVVVLQIYGGTAMQPQLSALKSGVHAVVGTPGRVLDHIRRRSLDLSRVRMVVLDEADEMLSMGFLEDIHAILDACNKTDRQTTLFSATVPSDVERIARRYMRQPETIKLSGDQVAAEEILHAYYTVAGAMKIRDLLDVIDLEEPATGLIFCNTREETNMVAAALRREGHRAEPLSSDLTQTARERVMGRMREGKLRFLVATDVASRGIDISHISHVINYSFPENAESYIHRTGRTGRAGRAGLAISLIAPQELGNHYYLKLQYPTLKFEERQLPPAAELQKQRIETKLDQVSHMFPELVSPEWTLLARNLMGDPRGERVIAYLLSEGIPARTLARAEADGEGDEIEYRKPRESRGRGREFDREGPRDRDRDRDRGRGRDRDRHWDRDREPPPPEGVAAAAGEDAARPQPDRDADRWDRGGERRQRRGRGRDGDRERGRSAEGGFRDRDAGRTGDVQARVAEPFEPTLDRPEPVDTTPEPAPASEVAEAGAPERRELEDGQGEHGRRRRRRRGRRRGGEGEGDAREGGELEAREPSTFADASSPTTSDATVSDAWVETRAEREPIGAGSDASAGDEAEGTTVRADALADASEISTDPESLTSPTGRRRRRRRRRRGGAERAEGAVAQAGHAEGDEGDDEDAPERTPTSSAGQQADGAGGRSRRRRRRGRRRGKEHEHDTERERERAAPPPPQHVVSQDEIVIDIDETELEVVRDEFGEIDELDELTLKGRRRGVMDALEEEVELEDMSGRDAPSVHAAAEAQDAADSSDVGADDDDDDGDDEDTGTEAQTADEDDEAAQKRRRRRRRRKKKKEPPPPPELTAPPHKDFWEVWAAKFSYTDFEDDPFFAHNDIPPEPEEPEVPEPRPAARGGSRRAAAAAPAIDFSEPEEAEWVTVRLNVGRKHGKKAAHVRELFAEHYGLGGRAIRNLTVGEASTKLRMGAQAYGRAMERAGTEVDGVTLALTLLDGTAADGEDDVGTSAAGSADGRAPTSATSADDAGESPDAPQTEAAEPAALTVAADEPDAPAAT